MAKKIAIITTDFLEKFIRETLEKLDMGFEYQIFVYMKFEDIEDIGKRIGEEYDGILTSGSFPAHMLRLYDPEKELPIVGFNSDDSSLYRLLLELLQENRNLDFSRVYADIIEFFGGNLEAFVAGKEAMPDLTELSEEEFPLERMRRLEEEEYEKHVRLWREGKTDLSITRFSSLMKRLTETGIKVYFPYPGEKYIKEVCEKLLREIERRELKERQPGIVVIRVFEERGGQERMKSDYEQLERMVRQFLGNAIVDFSLNTYQDRLELVAAKKDMEQWLEGDSGDRLCSFLKVKKHSWKFGIGYGFGAGIGQTRLNALNACHEAVQKKNVSYVMTENENLIGPLGTEKVKTVRVESRSYLDITSSLSPITVSKVFSVLDATEHKEITAKELAFRLGITKRSANRFLSTLEEEGWLQVAYRRRMTSRGRPEGVFVRTAVNTAKTDGTPNER